MSNAHRTNVLVTSCLKTPVDPQTKAPLASYERGGVLRAEQQGSEELGRADRGSRDAKAGSGLDLSHIFFSNEEYYRKLEELKEAHLQTMADLESMYQQKLLLRSSEGPAPGGPETGARPLSSDSSPAAPQGLRKTRSTADLRRSSGQSGSSGRPEADRHDAENELLFSPKEYIKNMWRDFQIPPHTGRLSSSLRSLPLVPQAQESQQEHEQEGGEPAWRRSTIPKPFQMTLRESERRRRGLKTRGEVEMENRELRRQLEELTECQKQFRASPVPAHIYLPPQAERRKGPTTVPKPFSFLERERLKKERREQSRPPSEQDKVPAFRAKPVPPSVHAAASGERLREEQLHRAIKIHTRAQELLHSAATPPSMVARRLSERRKSKEAGGDHGDGGHGDSGVPHRPRINGEVPDFEASYRSFQKHLNKRRQWKASTTCEPFQLRTSQICSHRERVLAELEREQSSPRELRWPFLSPGPPPTPSSSLCSSLSGSLELLPAKVTAATEKRHQAVRKALELRRKAEEEEEHWREKQRQREKRLQRVVSQRAQANDPHLALSQTHQSKLKEFRRQELQRRREYQQEIKEMERRVMGRPLLLEQVAQKNAKQAADRRYVDALQEYDLTEEFVLSKAARSGAGGRELLSADGPPCDQDEPKPGYESVHYRRVVLDDEDLEVNPNEDGGSADEGEEDADQGGADAHCSDENNSYSEDHESYSSDSDHDVETKQEAA